MKLKINRYIWKVIFCDTNDKRINFSNDVYCGLTNKITLVIIINNSLSKEMIERTIVHELTHAYIWSYGFENVDFSNEETVCNFFEAFGRDIMRDKDKILKYFYKK